MCRGLFYILKYFENIFLNQNINTSKLMDKYEICDHDDKKYIHKNQKIKQQQLTKL
jgi:DNA-directed RNA polymerase subunit H (RpoH/RPB5)